MFDLVLKAYIRDGCTNFLITRKWLSRNDVTSLADNRLRITPSTVVIAKYEGVCDLPDGKVLCDFDDTGYIIRTVVDYKKYLKELNPDYDFNTVYKNGIGFDINKWVMFNGRGYCKYSVLGNHDGVWGLNGEIIQYTWESPIRVLHDGNKRHRLEQEYERITINIQTGESIYTGRLYKNDKMRNTELSFNKKYGLWVVMDSFVEEDIIGIRRDA